MTFWMKMMSCPSAISDKYDKNQFEQNSLIQRVITEYGTLNDHGLLVFFFHFMTRFIFGRQIKREIGRYMYMAVNTKEDI